MSTLLAVALRYRALTLAALLVIVVGGLLSWQRLPMDATPDLTPVQVQVLTRSPALGPLEVEQFITFPIEASLAGLPGLTELRSVSRYGLSVVTAIFRDDVDVYRARQLVNERLTQVAEGIPAKYGHPAMGPLTTGLGEVYQFTVTGEGYSPMAVRTLLQWDIARRLRAVPGVVEVNIWGGDVQQYQVIVDPAKLLAYHVTLRQVFEALEQNNALMGGGYIEHEREQMLLRGEALATTEADLRHIVIDHGPGGVPILVGDVGEVKVRPGLRLSAATANGTGETVIGMVQMLAGANADEVVAKVKARMQEIQRTLPSGVHIEPYYDRSLFVSRVLDTVRRNLLEGALLVIAVLFVFLGDVRMGLIVAAAIPLSMLMAVTGMLYAGLSGNLMSLGAIDFGLLVDGSVVVLDNILRRVARQPVDDPDERLRLVQQATQAVLRPVLFAVGIIIVVYLPILMLTGLEGKLFRPMALTVILTLAGSLVVAIAITPVLAFWFADARRETDGTWLTRHVQQWYAACLAGVMRQPRIIVAAATGLFLVSLGLGARLGVEFVPRLDEGDLAVNVWRLPSASLSESVATSLDIERVLRRFPEVVQVVTRTGSPDVATDVMGVDMSDVFVILKPRAQWTTARSREELIGAMKQAVLDAVPGVTLGFTQPIEMRFNELIGGTRSDLAIKVFGEDLEVLRRTADTIGRILERVPGAADVKVEQVAGLPLIRVIVERAQIARYGLTADDVLTLIETTRVGHLVGTIIHQSRRFDLMVRLNDQASTDPTQLGALLLPAPHGELVPLSRVATIQRDSGPAQISRQDVQRRIVVEANIRGRDLGGFITEARQAIAQHVALPSGYSIHWGGQYEHLHEASVRLAIVVPVTLVLVFSMLTVTFGSMRPALLIFLNVPLALSGGILALWVRGLPLSVSAVIGFIALFGIAVLNGVVLVSHIRDLEGHGMETETAVRQGALDRLRPVLMTALVASLGFVPMAVATSMGAEVQRPLATVVIGGLITSTSLTLLVIPAVYGWMCRHMASSLLAPQLGAPLDGASVEGRSHR